MTEVRPGTWRLRVTVGTDPETGHAIQKSKTVTFDKRRGTKGEATEALRAFVSEARAQGTVGTTATVGKLLTDWLATLDRLGKARTTIESYTAHVEKHIRPGLGSIRLDRLTAHDIDRYLADLKAKGLADTTIKLDHACLRAALEQGVDWGWIRDNPAKRARLATSSKAPAEAFTTEHLTALYNAAVAEDIDMAAVIVLAALTGCRRGELCGLRWDDLDRDARSLRVERQWVAGKGGQELEDGTKNGKTRTVYIGAAGVDLLDRYRVAKLEQTGIEPDGWLLSADSGTTPLRAKGVTEYVSKLAKRLKVPGHLHTIRHWKQTEMNRLGVDLPTAADQGGHSVGVMAGTYLHTSPERAAAAGELVAGVVGEALLLDA